MIITKTPFRMSFFGGGTDMEEYFKENGGAVLSTTFDKYCYVNVRHLPRFFDYSTELSYSKTERVTDINDIQHELYEKGMKAGALGGKLLGAGGGGFLVFYVQPEKQEAVKAAMKDLMYIPFKFEDGGTQVIYYGPEEYEKVMVNT